MTKPTTATIKTRRGARVTDRAVSADRDSNLCDADFALRIIAHAVRMKLHKRADRCLKNQ